MRFSTARLWIFLTLSALTAVRTLAQPSGKEGPVSDSNYAFAVRQYHSFVSPEVGLYRGIQYIDYDYTVQVGQPFFGPDSIRYGSVWYGGVAYHHVRMLYDLVKNQLVILDPFNVYKISVFMDLVDSFQIDRDLLMRIDDSLAPATLRSRYWEPIYRGNIALLKQERKALHDNVVITADNIRLYIDSSTSYYVKKGSGYYPVNTRKELFNLVKNRRSDARRLIRKNKLRWHTDKERILFLVTSWYDSINH